MTKKNYVHSKRHAASHQVPGSSKKRLNKPGNKALDLEETILAFAKIQAKRHLVQMLHMDILNAAGIQPALFDLVY